MHSKRVMVVHTEIIKDKSIIFEKRYINNPNDANEFIRQFYRNCDKEKVYVVCLNTKREVTSVELVSIGTSESSFMGVKEIFKTAILSNSHSIIAFHNHPSGSCIPSVEDVKMSSQLKEAGKIIGIEFEDHIILGENNEYLSIRETGLL